MPFPFAPEPLGCGRVSRWFTLRLHSGPRRGRSGARNALESSAGRDIVLFGAAAAIVGGVSLLGGQGRLAQAVRAAAMPSSQSVDDAEQKSVSPLALGVDVVAQNSLLVHAVLRQDRD
jgi:hypothetical protein